MHSFIHDSDIHLHMKHHYFFLVTIAAIFLAMAVVFNVFPRSTFSELERRELATFPDFTLDKLTSGNFTKEVSSWFSDSEPYRDQFMTLNMEIKDRLSLKRGGEDEITIHDDAGGATPQPEVEQVEDPNNIAEFHPANAAEEKAKIASRGIIVVGSEPNARALMMYGGVKGGEGYARAANKYKEALGDKVNVYSMVIPNSTEYYLPDKVKSKSKSMLSTVLNVHENLAPGVKAVDVYTILGKHASEPIFLRTDHHWAPLGAYYAAQKFAEVAGVPFKDLSNYDTKVTHDFVGTMYGYSKDIAIKKSPEDFVYYVPRGVNYTTTYITYSVDKDFNITHESKPSEGPFFQHHKDGSGSAYCTFMGGDTKITQVRTSTKNGRRLIILKDSFGNAIPGFLFYSFEEIHVIDGRYFNKNMKRYVADNKITDILFANNVFKVYAPSIEKEYVKFLTQ